MRIFFVDLSQFLLKHDNGVDELSGLQIQL